MQITLPAKYAELQEAQNKRNAIIEKLIAEARTDAERFTETRRYGLGGSDMPALMGVSPWSTAYDIWKAKTFRGDKPFTNDIPLEVGHELEDMIARRYEHITGHTVYPAQSVAMVGYEFLVGNFDRVVFDKPVEEGGKLIGGLECKTTSDNYKCLRNGAYELEWGTPNEYDEDYDLISESDLIPPKYYPQVQFYMAISGLEWWDVTVLISNREIRNYRVHRNNEYIEQMITRAVEFWTENVLKDVAPPKMFEDSKKNTSPAGAEKEADQAIICLVNEINTETAKLKVQEAKVEALKDELAPLIDDYTKITYVNDEGKKKNLITYSVTHKFSFNEKDFKADAPELYEKCCTMKPVFDAEALKALDPAKYDAYLKDSSYRVLRINK